MTNRTMFCFLSVGLLMLLAWSEGIACSCVPYLDAEPLSERVTKAKLHSGVVFTGTVLKTVEHREDAYISVDLKVIDLWKGKLNEKVTVLTGLHDSNCGFAFKIGETYLVYSRMLGMYSDAKRLSTTMCHRTALLSDAKADIGFLGPRRKPLKK